MSRSYRLRNYVVKIKEFRHALISQFQLLGYTVIIVSQIKFSGNIVLFGVRLLLQSFLSAPYPTDNRLTAFINYYRTHTADGSDPNVQIRKAFKKIGLATVHVTLLLNFLVIVCGIIWPMDFEKHLEHFKMPGIRHLENYPSPFNHGADIIEGEMRRHWFTQYIGERVPSSNLKGNASYLFFQLLILFFQVGLLLISAQCFSPFKEQSAADEAYLQRRPNELSDGYNGNVLILELNPKTAVEELLVNTQTGQESTGQESTGQRNPESMV